MTKPTRFPPPPIRRTVPMIADRREAGRMRHRLFGGFLVVLCALAIVRLRDLVMALPRHQPTLAEMLLSLAAVVAGIGGALLIREGRALFEDHPWPPRADPRR
jgi:heme A synthase